MVGYGFGLWVVLFLVEGCVGELVRVERQRVFWFVDSELNSYLGDESVLVCFVDVYYPKQSCH